MTDSQQTKYHALFSSDWSECLAPCGPFDVIAFHYPKLEDQLNVIFKQYTGNKISLGQAAGQIKGLLPSLVTREQVDTYLQSEFKCYAGVRTLIDWCREHDVLFMINTTGAIGYFQRVVALGLLPPFPILSAHPWIRFPESGKDPDHVFELYEIEDKSQNTLAAARTFNIPSERIMIMGDSGGDGPHFQWGHTEGACLVGSMTKYSLDSFCRDKGIRIDHRIGPTYRQGDVTDIELEMGVDVSEVISVMADHLRL